MVVSALAYFIGKTIDGYKEDKSIGWTARAGEYDKVGSVIEPKSDAVIEMEEMFARNDKLGQDTPLKDII